MPWGIFEVERPEQGGVKEIHIAPCTTDDYLLPGHKLSTFCECHPEIELHDGLVFRVIHNQI